jgi:hypothetical protein
VITGVEHGTSRRHNAHDVDKLAGFADPVLEQVGPAPPAGFQDRCRHGHPSAQPATNHEDRDRVIYIRKDELLHDLAATLTRGNGRPPTPDEVPALLRELQTGGPFTQRLVTPQLLVTTDLTLGGKTPNPADVGNPHWCIAGSSNSGGQCGA